MRDSLQVLDGRKDHVEFASANSLEGVTRGNPRVGDRLPGVVSGLLMFRRERHEESRIESTGRPNRCDPVGVVLERGEVEPKLLLGDDVAESDLLGVERSAVFAEPLSRCGITQFQVLARFSQCQQESRLFEYLTEARDVVGQTATLEREPLRRGLVVESDGNVMHVGVREINRAAGKDVGAADEVTVQISSQHEDFNPRGTVTHEQDSGGRPGHEMGAHGTTVALLLTWFSSWETGSPASLSAISTEAPVAETPKKNVAKNQRGGRPAGLFTWLTVGIVVVVVGVLVVMKISSGSSAQNDTGWTAADAAVVADLTSVPQSVFDTVGINSPVIPVTKPEVHLGEPQLKFSSASGAKLPGVLYYGAEYCPFCAAQRWPTIIALSRFGTWSNLGNSSSSAQDYYPNTPTFTFYKATFTSPYVAVQTVEEATNTLNSAGTSYEPLQKPTKEQTAIVTKYDTAAYFPQMTAAQSGSIPFLTIGNRIMWAGSSISPSVFKDQQRADIASALKNPNNPLTQAIISSANYITASICSQTAQAPAAVCSSPGVKAAKSALGL